MPFDIHRAVPWGRSFDEYRRMFDLGPAHVRSTILDCAGGPASFNAEASRTGTKVVSIDPIYQCSPHEIRRRVEETREVILDGVRQEYDRFVWNDIASPEALGRLRFDAMEKFIADFADRNSSGRYVAAQLPDLPFRSRSFDLALSSHFLFLYSEQLGGDFHEASLMELTRVAAEVRIFPLLDMEGKPSAILHPAISLMESLGHSAAVVKVPYEFQKGGNMMLRVVTC